jgi:hypothetical protein
MWIIHPEIGLVSVVVADDQLTGKPSADRIMLRSRRHAHLANLKRICPSLTGAQITAARTDLDYPMRLVVDRAVFVEALAELGRTLDYRNVKAEAHRHEAELGSDFVSLMHRVHATLAQVDDEGGKGPAR